MPIIETDVLVVGSGLTGASLAAFLGRHGIDVTVVTRERWVADSPRAHITNQRTMEVMRSVGLDAACYAVATPGQLMANHVMLTAIAGEEFGRIWTWGNHPERLGEYAAASPCTGCDLPQHRFEPILLGEAARLGAALRFDVDFLDFEQDDDGVTSRLVDRSRSEEFLIRSKYLVGCDGGQSRVAELAELPLVGTPGLSNALNVWFEADLSRHVAHRPGSLYWILQPDREGGMGNAMVRMVRPWDEWVVGFVHLGETVANLNRDEVTEQVRSLIQDDSIEVTVKGVYPWRINQVYAESYASGRVFAAGDAVHRHPPMNGLGGNTCVQDAFNLSWKLAAVVQGRAGDGLLNSYSAERQPIGRQVVDRAVASWRQNPEVMHSLGIDPTSPPADRQRQLETLGAPTEEGRQRRTAFAKARDSKAYSYHAHGVEMNQMYRSDAVVPDGTEFHFVRDPELFHTATTYPGAHLPHCWVGVAGRTVSTLDLARPEQFTLLTGVQGPAWLDAASSVATELGISLVALRIGPGGEVADLYGDWSRLCEIDESGCLLVRPDQHIAWRCRVAGDDPTADLSRVMRQILDRPGNGGTS
jgi:2,4-dichlorophenol 6-monooxygenase